LFTGDVDDSEHHLSDDKRAAFERIVGATAVESVPTTFFFVAREAEKLPDSVRLVGRAGHEVGCHGLTHGDEEEYSTISESRQAEFVDAATVILQDIAGRPVTSFRAPRVKVSAATYGVLAKAGYVADSSICSQRLDLISSNWVQTGWLRAPRLPYYPSAASPYERGDVPVLIVPVSAVAVPFISSALYVLGLGFMKALFRILYEESKVTGKPIVYLYHPYEFIREIAGAKDYHTNLRVHGLRVRRHLYRGTPDQRFEWTMNLIRYMHRFPGVEFMTMSRFAESYTASC
jgi:hypothetical protein